MFFGHKGGKETQFLPMAIPLYSRLPTDTPAIIDLLKARESIVTRLQQSVDYRALEKLDATIHELRETVSVIASDDAVAVTAEAETESNTVPEADAKGKALFGYSHANGAYRVFQAFKRPMPIAELVATLNANGLVIGGKEPTVNLSSSLSKDERFQSIRWNGRPCWWLKGVSPAEVKTAGEAPAA